MTKEVQDLANILQSKKSFKNLKSEKTQTENKLMKNQSTSPRCYSNSSSIESIDNFRTINNSSTSKEEIEININSQNYTNSDNNVFDKKIDNEKFLIQSHLDSLSKQLLTIQTYQQKQSFSSKDIQNTESLQGQDNENNNNLNNLEILQNHNNKNENKGSTLSVFNQFRLAISRLKSKLFYEPNIKKLNKYPDVCNKCLGKLLSDDTINNNYNNNFQLKTIYHLNPEHYINNNNHNNNNEDSIPSITVCGKQFRIPSKKNESFSNNEIIENEQIKQNSRSSSLTSLLSSSPLLKDDSNTSKTFQIKYEKNLKTSYLNFKKYLPLETHKIYQQYSYQQSINDDNNFNQPINMKKLQKIQNISNIDFFIILIREDLKLENDYLVDYENHLKELYQNNIIFKKDLDLTVQLGCPQFKNDNKKKKVKNCQDIVRVMACLKKIRIIYTPYRISVIFFFFIIRLLFLFQKFI